MLLRWPNPFTHFFLTGSLTQGGRLFQWTPPALLCSETCEAPSEDMGLAPPSTGFFFTSATMQKEGLGGVGSCSFEGVGLVCGTTKPEALGETGEQRKGHLFQSLLRRQPGGRFGQLGPQMISVSKVWPVTRELVEFLSFS